MISPVRTIDDHRIFLVSSHIFENLPVSSDSFRALVCNNEVNGTASLRYSFATLRESRDCLDRLADDERMKANLDS